MIWQVEKGINVWGRNAPRRKDKDVKIILLGLLITLHFAIVAPKITDTNDKVAEIFIGITKLSIIYLLFMNIDMQIIKYTFGKEGEYIANIICYTGSIFLIPTYCICYALKLLFLKWEKKLENRWKCCKEQDKDRG